MQFTFRFSLFASLLSLISRFMSLSTEGFKSFGEMLFSYTIISSLANDLDLHMKKDVILAIFCRFPHKYLHYGCLEYVHYLLHFVIKYLAQIYSERCPLPCLLACMADVSFVPEGIINPVAILLPSDILSHS